jgi:hypothetical protein
VNHTWSVLLDGLVGSFLTGLIAGGAVWLTIRHERRLAANERLIDTATTARHAIESEIRLRSARNATDELMRERIIEASYSREAALTMLESMARRIGERPFEAALSSVSATMRTRPLRSGDRAPSGLDGRIWWIARLIVAQGAIDLWVQKSAALGELKEGSRWIFFKKRKKKLTWGDVTGFAERRLKEAEYEAKDAIEGV